MTPDSNTDTKWLLRPSSAAFASDDLRWIAQIKTLTDSLRTATDGLHFEEQPPRSGEKGNVAEIILALGTSGAIAAVLSAFKLWLGRSSDRRIELIIEKAGKKVGYTLKADNLDPDTFKRSGWCVESPC